MSTRSTNIQFEGLNLGYLVIMLTSVICFWWFEVNILYRLA